MTRADVTATLGWLAADSGARGPFSYRAWDSSLFGSIGGGWYWTDHLKTEVDFGAGTEGDAYFSHPVTINRVPAYRSAQRKFSRRVLGTSVQYQFFRNAWFHPHLGAGANFTWDRITDRYEPVVFYDQVARTSRLLEDGRQEGPRTEFDVRPFVAAGFKAYMSRRTFFRSDLRIGFNRGADESILRFGFGADF